MNSVTVIATLIIPVAVLAGSKAGLITANIIEGAHPSWGSALLGPLGALTGTVLAIRWLLKRLDKQEMKADIRDEERIKQTAIITEMTLQNQAIIAQNSTMLAEAKFAIEKCTRCEVKHLIKDRHE